MNLAPTKPAPLWLERLKTVVVIGGMLILAGFAVDAYFYQNHKRVELTAHPRYTVGEVVKTGVVISPSSHGYSLFTYQVGDSVYTQEGPDEIPKGHTRFLVKFSTQHPTYYKFYERVPIPYYVPPPPPEGWAKLPPELDIPAGTLD
jgi:hypothetical protein